MNAHETLDSAWRWASVALRRLFQLVVVLGGLAGLWVFAAWVGLDLRFWTPGGVPGFIYVETPEVYTRERLVNDRFSQANWLRAQLALTEDVEEAERLTAASISTAEAMTAAIRAGALGSDGPPQTDESARGEPANPVLDYVERFQKINAYRDWLRGELMDIQLDDGHDLDGNTLYRLNFNAVVMPFADQMRDPGTAIVIVEAQAEHDGAEKDDDDLELLYGWQRQMQQFLSRVVDQRIETFNGSGAVGNPTDPKEDVALDWWLRTELIERFLAYLEKRPGPMVGKDLQAVCQQLPELSELQKSNCRMDRLAELADFGWRAERPSPEVLDPAVRERFRAAINIASHVEEAQWPWTVENRSVTKCLRGLDPNKCRGKQPFADPRQLRGLMRLLSVMTDIERFPVPAAGDPHPEKQAELRSVAPNAKQEMAGVIAGFAGVVPDEREVETLSTELEGLEYSEERIDRKLGASCATKETVVDYARCRFLRSRTNVASDLLTRFVVDRVNDELGAFYETEKTALKDYLVVRHEGCGLTGCRITVGVQQADEDGTQNGLDSRPSTLELAHRLATALDSRMNGLHVYEVSPRLSGAVRRAEASSAVGANFGTAFQRLPFAAELSAGAQQVQVGADATVVGFSQVTKATQQPADTGRQAVFGWAVRSTRGADGRWAPSHNRLSAVLSVPSWWKRLDLTITACWVLPAEARAAGASLYDDPATLCQRVHGAAPPIGAAAEPRQQPYFVRNHRLQLPRSFDEVVSRFNFEFIKSPYFDAEWLRSTLPDYQLRLTAGRPAHVALAGVRLWRGTVVTIAGQPSDSITVLPDMKGVIAEFRCLLPAPNVAKGSRPPPSMLTVWTAEGRTQPLPVDIRPFDPFVPGERPCYVSGGLLKDAAPVEPKPQPEPVRQNRP